MKQEPPKTSAGENAAHLIKRPPELRKPLKGFLLKTAAEGTVFPGSEAKAQIDTTAMC